MELVIIVCRSLPRHRILASYMIDHIGQFRDKDILHIAQERSLRRWMVSHHIGFETADLYKRADLNLDIEDSGLDDESYDIIICNHVLEHVKDYRKALRELYRIIRPKGFVIISFPVDFRFNTVYENCNIVCKKDRIQQFGQADHLRVFGRDSKEILESIGFFVTEIRGDDYDDKIKPIVGPADYDYNVLWLLTKIPNN